MTGFRYSDFEMFSFLERSPDLVCIAGKDGFLKKVNPAVVDKLGYSTEELLSRPIETFIHPDDRDLTKRERKKLLSGKNLVNFKNRYIQKNGGVLWLEWTSVYFPEKELVFAIAKDISARKLAEDEIEEKYKKFKSLATHFKSSIEKDRKFLSVELHEELAQLASVVKNDIEWVQLNEQDMSELSKSRIDHAMAVSELVINTIRRISFSISPKMLEDYGLNDTLKWHCKEFAILNGIPCVFESNCDESVLTHEIKLDFFRICQESLSNIMYHAQAGKVAIAIKEQSNKVTLTITNDGKGFNLKQQEKLSWLTGIRERVASINGRLSIKSESGTGTTISVTISK